MEDILASIKKVIAEEKEMRTVAPPVAQPQYEAVEAVLMVWGPGAGQLENDWAFDYLPRLTGDLGDSIMLISSTGMLIVVGVVRPPWLEAVVDHEGVLTATVAEALNRMLEEGFRHLPVLETGDLVGIVSLRDLSRGSSG